MLYEDALEYEFFPWFYDWRISYINIQLGNRDLKPKFDFVSWE